MGYAFKVQGGERMLDILEIPFEVILPAVIVAQKGDDADGE